MALGIVDLCFEGSRVPGVAAGAAAGRAQQS